MVKSIISPSILASDFANLGCNCKKVVDTGDVDWLHLDVMDGHFVPNLSFGLPLIRQIKSISQLPLDVHLMINNPDTFIEAYLDAGADLLTFHLEATAHPHRLIQQIHARGAKAGISINPGTDIGLLTPLLKEVDLILLMTVNPGFGGQSFLPFCLTKIRDLSNLVAQQKNKLPHISVDGGIDAKTAPLVRQAGANVLVAGSFIYGASDRHAAIFSLRS